MFVILRKGGTETVDCLSNLSLVVKVKVIINDANG